MLTLRSRIFVWISVVVLLILGISLFIVVITKNKAAPTAGGEVASSTEVGGGNGTGANIINTGNIEPTVVTGLQVRPQSTLEAQQNGVRQLARLFIERYNSFSTDNEWGNITEVKDLVTADLWKSISPYIGKSSNGAKIAVTTQAISTNLDAWEEKSATVSISAMREEIRNGVSQKLQKSYTVQLVKNGEDWLVDKFEVAK